MEPSRKKSAGTSRASISSPTVERRRSSRISARRFVYCGGSSSDDDVVAVPTCVKSPINCKHLGKDQRNKLAKRVNHFSDAGDVLSDSEDKSAFTCNCKHDGKSVKSQRGKAALNSKVSTKKFPSGHVAVTNDDFNPKPTTCCNKKTRRSTLSPTKCKPSTKPKMNVSYALSDISDDDALPDGVNIPMFSVYDKFKSNVANNNRSTLNTMSMPGPSEGNSSRSQSSLSSCNDRFNTNTNTADEIDLYINEMLESSSAQTTTPFKNTKDFINETERLLSMTSDLIEIDNSPTPDESVVFVGKRPISTVEKEEHKARLKNKKPDEIIDLCASINSPKVVTPDNKKNPGRRNIGECPICFETLDNLEVAATICGHVFCKPCIHHAIVTCKKCPNCRKRLTLKQIHPLFI